MQLMRIQVPVLLMLAFCPGACRKSCNSLRMVVVFLGLCLVSSHHNNNGRCRMSEILTECVIKHQSYKCVHLSLILEVKAYI